MYLQRNGGRLIVPVIIDINTCTQMLSTTENVPKVLEVPLCTLGIKYSLLTRA